MSRKIRPKTEEEKQYLSKVLKERGIQPSLEARLSGNAARWKDHDSTKGPCLTEECLNIAFAKGLCSTCLSRDRMSDKTNKDRRNLLLREKGSEDPLFYRKGNLSKYGLTPESYHAMLVEQNYVCDVCKKPPARISKNTQSLHVDHSHTSDKVRGLLCQNCNTALGSLREDMATVNGLLSYMVKHNIAAV